MLQGLLGSITYVGLTVTSPIGGYLLMRFNPKRVVVIFLALNATSTLMFAWAPDTNTLLTFRTMIGATQVRRE
jgi:predicted MFS family arabinose efflux permease